MKFVTYSQWDELPASASRLFAEGERHSLFCSRIWLETISSHGLTKHQSILIACVEEQENSLAILPMVNTTQGGRDNQSDLGSLSNNHTTLFSPLITNNNLKEAAIKCLADGLANNLANYHAQTSSNLIRFEPIDPYDENMTELCQEMESCGFQIHRYFRFYNWVHPLSNQSFDEYLSERPANLRNTIKRKQRKLARETLL